MTAISNTLFIGKVLKHYEAAASTNALAADLMNNEKINEGAVLYTFNQTAGRGQYGNKWQCEPFKNIAVSIILTPTFLNPREQFYLNQSMALGIHDAITAYLPNGLTIKWANDIYIHDKKICGTLIQNALSGNSIQSSIIGIGINVNQKAFNDLPNATSLCIERNEIFPLFDIVEKLCQCIERRYLQLKSRQFGKIHDEYLSKLYRFGEDAFYQYLDGSYFSGKIVGVNEAGKLEIESKKGLEEFDIKEVKFVI